MESAVKPVCSQTSLDDACSFVLHSNSLICRPHRPQAEKPEKQIYKSNFPAQFSCTLCSIPFQNCGSLMTDCTAYHDVFRTIPVSLFTLKWGAKTPPIVINMWHKYMSTGKDTPISHKVTELHVVTVTIVRLLSICDYNTLSPRKNSCIQCCLYVCFQLFPSIWHGAVI